MKIIIFSDSHGRVGAMQEIAKRESPDLILHLGDHERDCDGLFSGCRVLKVRGNCDYGSLEESERLLDFGKTKIWMTHGDLYGVKQGLTGFLKEGTKKGATILLYGHTHRSYLSRNQDYTVMNPGTPDQSYGVIELEKDEVKAIRLEESVGCL